MWEILQQTIHRVSTLVQRCHADLETARKRLRDASEQEAPPTVEGEEPSAPQEPKEEDVTEALEEAHDRSLSQQKNMFLVIFQVSILTTDLFRFIDHFYVFFIVFIHFFNFFLIFKNLKNFF